MSQPTLVERLERVERENRCWKIIGISVMTIIALALLMGAARPRVQNEVRARQFTLVNKEGKVRGLLGFSAVGSPTLLLFDNPILTLFDSEQRPRARLAVESGGWPRLSLYDKGQRRRAALQVFPGGSPGLTLRDKDGKITWKAP